MIFLGEGGRGYKPIVAVEKPIVSVKVSVICALKQMLYLLFLLLQFPHLCETNENETASMKQLLEILPERLLSVIVCNCL